MRYQPRWIKGQSAGDLFQRESETRYARIKSFLEKYQRPFSVFDLGANLGYFSFRIAEDFPQATVIMVDDKPELYELCQENGLDNTVLLPVHLTGSLLKYLSSCESFDVVLGLNVLHHIPDWHTAVEALLAMGDNVIIETPGEGDVNAVNTEMHLPLLAYLLDRDHEVINVTDSHVSDAKRFMLLFQEDPNAITQQTLDAVERGAPELGKIYIRSSFTEKTVTIDHRGATPITEERAFVPGMNLWNWKLLLGKWPGDIEERIRCEVAAMESWHDDLKPWNFILSGDRCVAIDRSTKAWKEMADQNDLEECLALFREGSAGAT